MENKEITKDVKNVFPVITKEDVKKFFCESATEKEIAMFLEIAKIYQLNPFKRELYLVKYQGQNAHIITGYETYLKRAERTEKWGGFKVWTEGKIPDMKACIEIYRKDWEKPLYHEVEYSEYVQKTKEGKVTRFWAEKSRTMLKKVVISQGFRFAFPDELGGMPYTSEEMPILEPLPEPKISKKEEKVKEKVEDEKEEIPAEDSKFEQMLNRFAKAKNTILDLAKSDEMYYDILHEHGYNHSNEIERLEIGEVILKGLGQLASALMRKTKKEPK